MTPLRRRSGTLAWAAALFYAAVLMGGGVYGLYLGVKALISMPRTVAVITSESGAQISLNPAEWNAHAWRLATDSDPSMRDPAEAVRLAELTVAADPKNALYVKTLGVARYRAGDFTAAIEALKRSIDIRGFNGQDAFFLAMAHARLGHHEEAGQWYLQANGWTRQKQPNNAELRRFREEAAAVLDVADDKPREPKRATNAPPLSKDTAPATKPK